MTLAEIKNQVMFQTNNDPEDIEDYLPHINDYINEAYDRLVHAWKKAHVGSDAEYFPLAEDEESPDLPEWTHRALADYATWMIYRNGNPQKQQRAVYFRQEYAQVLSSIEESGGENGLNEDGTEKVFKKFRNIPG